MDSLLQDMASARTCSGADLACGVEDVDKAGSVSHQVFDWQANTMQYVPNQLPKPIPTTQHEHP
jgi:hypothetical protein